MYFCMCVFVYVLESLISFVCVALAVAVVAVANVIILYYILCDFDSLLFLFLYICLSCVYLSFDYTGTLLAGAQRALRID